MKILICILLILLLMGIVFVTCVFSMANVPKPTKKITDKQAEEILLEAISLVQSDYSFEEIQNFLHKKIDSITK